MRRGSILAGTVVLCLLCSLGLEGQQSDSSIANNTNLPASSQSTAGTFPRLIKFTGGVKDLTDKVPTGVVGLTFSLYELPEGGGPLWTETQSLPLDSLGRYTALLGANSPGGMPLDLFTTGKTLWLGVQPQLAGQAEQPRVLLVAVPYALKASDSDTLGGKPASAYALAGSQTLVVPAAGAAPSSSSTAPPASQAASTAGSDSSPKPLAACSSVTSDGTATANTVAKFTSACNIENSLIRDNGTGVAVGGASAPAALFDIQYAPTATSGLLLGQRVLATFNPAATSSASNIAAYSEALIPPSNTQNFSGNVSGMNYQVNDYGTGTLSFGYGLGAYVTNRAAGTISKAYGLYANVGNGSTGTITNGYGLYVSPPINSGGGKFSTYTGVYIGNPTAVTGAYGLISAGGLNYFAGNVGIATATPAALLEVNGTTKFDGLVTFKSGQTFPGAGTVTSVASGTGLTGGPIMTTGTLSIATAGVADTMLADSYSGTGSCTTGKFVTGLSRATTPTCATPAGGTITGVTAGTDLTGGGTSGMVTLNLNTTLVPQLTANNSFTGSQSITGNLGVTDATAGDTALTIQATDTTAANTGISGLADGAGGTGVSGEAENGALAVGVWGISSSGMAGLFSGNVNISGNISKAGGSFKIDDPIDPANKYLYHSFVESPDMKNVYDGVVTLDVQGEAVVQLPDWFGDLNKDFRYQLTCIGAFAPVYIAEKINQNHFKIAGGKAGLEVSWQVTGIRQDAWANAHRIPVEVEKPAQEQGYYLHPELFGQPAEKSVDWADRPQEMKKLAAPKH